ncbi:MAG: class I SAM-dependent DNA methyltransferase, partial [Armatimonadetes bacterium]|nr:class I SAM-dependent DNA methyltransferase [Armatimonadota bacterium]
MAGRRSGKNSVNGQGNGVNDLLRQLWEAAVTLRGSIEAPDYKRYVLPIIFLRFLSLSYERRRAELASKIAESKAEYQVATPDSIVKSAQRDDIKIHLDNVLELFENTYPDRLKGLLPRIYANSNMEAENLRGLINLFSRDIFRDYDDREDLIGRVYEYFIGEFASSEGKRGGEYFTPASIVRTLVAMLEPEEGLVFDPCCGSGGMFVQADIFRNHDDRLSFYGQESKDFTYRLCLMNLFIHGISGNIQIGNSYTDDKHTTLRADYILANPPFNDGAKSEGGWGAQNVPDKDPRLAIGHERMALSPRNANTMWILHFLSHLAEGGTAGFVMASGELSSSETARLQVRKALIETEYVDCIVRLAGQLFANTPIPCCLWFLSKNRGGLRGFRNRTGEVLFIDGRKVGSLIPGSRKQKQLSDEEIERIAAAYREFKRTGKPEDVPGFCGVASIEEVREHGYALTPGRYVGTPDDDGDDEPVEEKIPRLMAALERQLRESS